MAQRNEDGEDIEVKRAVTIAETHSPFLQSFPFESLAVV